MSTVIKNTSELKRHINAIYNKEEKDKKIKEQKIDVNQKASQVYTLTQSITGPVDQLLQSSKLAASQRDNFTLEATDFNEKKDGQQNNQNLSTNIEYISNLKSNMQTISIEEKIGDFSNCLCVNTSEEIIYFNDNDKSIYKINYKKEVIMKKSLETKDNKNNIGDAKRLILTTPDNKYLVLGTNTGFVFIIQCETFQFDCKFKIPDFVEEIYFTEEKNNYHFYIQNSKNLFCITNTRQYTSDSPIPVRQEKPFVPPIEFSINLQKQDKQAPKPEISSIEIPKPQVFPQFQRQYSRKPSKHLEKQLKSEKDKDEYNLPFDTFLSFKQPVDGYKPQDTFQKFLTARSCDFNDSGSRKDFDGEGAKSEKPPKKPTIQIDKITSSLTQSSITSEEVLQQQEIQVQQDEGSCLNIQKTDLDNELDDDVSIRSPQEPDQYNDQILLSPSNIEKKDIQKEKNEYILSHQNRNQQNVQHQSKIIPNQNQLVLNNSEDESEDESAESLFDNQYDPSDDKNDSENNSNKNLTVPNVNKKIEGKNESKQQILNLQAPDQQIDQNLLSSNNDEKKSDSSKSDESIQSQQDPDEQNIQIQQNINFNQSSEGPNDSQKEGGSEESAESLMDNQVNLNSSENNSNTIQNQDIEVLNEDNNQIDENTSSLLTNQFFPQSNDNESQEESNNSQKGLSHSNSFYDSCRIAKFVEKHDQIVEKMMEKELELILTERRQSVIQESPTKTSSNIVSMQLMPLKNPQRDTPRQQPEIQTELVDQLKEVDFLAQDHYKLYFMTKQETQTYIELKSLKITNSLQMIVFEKIKTNQNTFEYFFTFYDLKDLKYNLIESQLCILINEKFSIPLKKISKFNPEKKVILELSSDEKKLYFNSTFLKIEGKIQNGIYEVCADIIELKRKKDNNEKIEIKEYLNINQDIVQEIIVLKDDRRIITLSRADTSGPLKITDLNMKQTKVIEFQQLLRQFEEKSLQDTKELTTDSVIIESIAITKDEKLLYLSYFSTKIKQSLILCYDLENQNLIMQWKVGEGKMDSEKLQIIQDLLIFSYKKLARQPISCQMYKILKQNLTLEKREMIKISDDKKYTFRARNRIFQLQNNHTKKLTSFGISIIPKTFTKDSQELIILNQNSKEMNRIVLEQFERQGDNYKMELICRITEGRQQGMTQVDDDKQFCYYMSEQGNLYQIIYYETNQIVATLKFPEGATFMLSRSKHQPYILVSYKDQSRANIIEKVRLDPISQKMYLDKDKKIEHQLSQTTLRPGSISNFDQESRVFIIGGNQSENIGVFNPKNMQQLFILEGHKEKGVNNCFFIRNEHNKNENIVITFTHNEMVCWYVKTIFEHWIKIYSVNQHIKPITGYNNQLTGLIIDEKFIIWNNRLLYELSDNRQKFIHYYEDELYRTKIKSQETWISGPNSQTFHERFQTFKKLCNFNQAECEKMLHTLLHNVVEPAGYTVLSWLASGGWTEYLRKALQMNPLYIRDKEGMTPLMYSLKIRNHEQVNLIMQFLVQNEKLMNQIDLPELQTLIIFSPPGLEDFLNKSVSVLDIGEKLGELQQQSTKKFIFQKELRADRIYDQLCIKKSEMNQDLQKSVVFKSSRLHLTMLPGSIESMQFHLALQKCQKKIFNTELIKNYIECKWQRVIKVAYVLTIMQLCNTLIINIHLFNPGRKKELFALILFAIWFIAIEVFVYFASGQSYMNVSYLSIILSIFTLIYSFIILIHGHNSSNNYLLPIINLLSWFKLVEDLRFFESIRLFVSLLGKSIKSLNGFFIFLFLMMLTFTSSLTIIKRNELRDRTIEMSKGDVSYDIDLFIRNGILKDWSDHANDYADAFYTICMMLYGEIQGEYQYNDLEIQQSTFLKIFSVIASFILLTILMNIIVSLMNETYGQQMSQKEESDGCEKNKLICHLETFIVWARFAGEPSYFAWAEYKDQPITEELSQTSMILQNIGEVTININHQLNNKILDLQMKMEENKLQQNETFKQMENQIKALRTELQIKLNHQQANQDSKHEEIMKLLRDKLP